MKLFCYLTDKDLFHEPSARIPMIVVDPAAPAEHAGRREPALVEAVDVLPTALEALGLERPAHLLEGDSLLNFTRGLGRTWREAAVCEIDYSFREARVLLHQDPRRCRGYMVRTPRWKYIFWEDWREQLFDMQDDAHELHDLGDDEGLRHVRTEHKGLLFDWMRARKLSVTVPDERICVSRHSIEPQHGIEIGVW